MAHEVYQHENGDYSMAFVGNTPWHGFGQKLNPDDPLEVWAEKSHLDWEIGESVGMFYPTTEDRFQKPIEIPKRKILYQNENLQSSKETAWGAVNAVTCYYDHKKRAHKIDNRLNNAWFENGANIKQQAWNKALLLAA